MHREPPFFCLYHYSIHTKHELAVLLEVDETKLKDLLVCKYPKFTQNQLITLAKTFRTSVWFLNFIFDRHTGVYSIFNILANFTIKLLFFRP